MSPLRYDPDEWAHDLDEMWAPLAGLAAGEDSGSDAWLRVLGVAEFFDHRLLGQPRVHTPWLCLAAAAVAATTIRQRALAGAGPDAIAVAAIELAIAMQELRWQGELAGSGVTSSPELAQAGRQALAARLGAAAARAPIAICLVAGWLSTSGRGLPAVDHLPPPRPSRPGRPATIRRMVAELISSVLAARPASQLGWGTAHLIDRLASGDLDDLPVPARPDDPPAEARAQVLLLSGAGTVGVFEARRQRSLLAVPGGLPTPDLARLAFVHASDDFLESVTLALAAASRIQSPAGPGELASWSLQVRDGRHPLAERAVTGRSAGLGAYVAFRSLATLDRFAARDVAFTGQVLADGRTGAVQGASGKIGAASAHGIARILHPAGQAWRDPGGAVQLEGVELAEDAVIAAAQQLRGLRSYLDAACRLLEPAPWLRTWLDRQQPARELELLQITCRQQHRAAEAARPGGGDGGDASQTPLALTDPDIPRCPAHQLASSHPGLSFAIGAEAGAGSTIAAKRMVAAAARRALDTMRTGPAPLTPLVIPIYLPVGELPASWDDLVRIGTAALPGPASASLDVAAAVARVLRDSGSRAGRPLVVADGIDRARRSGGSHGREPAGDFVSLVTGAPRQAGTSWQPRYPAQLVTFGRNASPAQARAAAALRQVRPGAMAEMTLEPLSGPEIDRFHRSLSGAGRPLIGKARELAANPLLLALSVIAGPAQVPDSGATDLLDRGIDVLLGELAGQRRALAEIAFRAALAKDEPAGEFTLTELAGPAAAGAVAAALAADDPELARAVALDRDERQALRSAANETHVITASGAGWRFFHDQAFAFLTADRLAWHCGEAAADEDALFAVLGQNLGDPRWADVIDATGRLLELHEDRLSPPA